jgi:acyl-CoA thioester hydrolase
MKEYSKTYEILWRDVDPNGHARHTSYLDYASHLRFAFMFERGFSHHEMNKLGIGPIIISEEAKYLREVQLGEKITISYSALGLSGDDAKFKLRHDIRNSAGKRAVRITLSAGWLDLETRKLISPPDELAAILREVPKDKNFREMPSL